MPRFRSDEYAPNAIPVSYEGSDLFCAAPRESGDAQVGPPIRPDYPQSVRDQKIEFSKYIRARSQRPKAEADGDRKAKSLRSCSGRRGRLESGTVGSDSTKGKNSTAEEKDGRSEERASCRAIGDEEFYKILQTKAPNIEETNSLLDQVLELRSALEDSVKELRGLAEEMRKISKVIKCDPFVSKSKLECEASMAKFISSVRTMQNLCAKMNKHSSESVLHAS